MKLFIESLILILSLPSTLGFAIQASETEQMKSDLIGKVMGGREKGWKFQSVAQIKELVINNKKESGQQRIYSVTLKLQDVRVPGAYKAEAEVIYEKTDSKWEIKAVGLKSFMRIG